MALLLLSPMNINRRRSRRSALIINHVALSLSFGVMFVDTVKMVFISDYGYDQELAEADKDQTVGVEDFSA